MNLGVELFTVYPIGWKMFGSASAIDWDDAHRGVRSYPSAQDCGRSERIVPSVDRHLVETINQHSQYSNESERSTYCLDQHLLSWESHSDSGDCP